MLCTSCSAVVKPVVAIDIDGTLADYHGMLLNLTCDYMGVLPEDRPPGSYDGTQNFGDWVCRSFGIERSDYRDIKLALRQGGYKRFMPPIGDVAAFVSELRASCEVWVTTTRPYMRHDSVDPDTREWLRRYGVRFDGLLYDEDKYTRLAEYVNPQRIIMVLDDLPEQYDSAAALFGKDVPILRRTHWNRGVYRDHTAQDLDEVLERVREQLLRWRREHEEAYPTGKGTTGAERMRDGRPRLGLAPPPQATDLRLFDPDGAEK